MSTDNLDIQARTRALIEHAVPPSRRFKDLEQIGGISAGTWRTFWTRNTYPSAQMLEALSRQWPQYAFWLVTGITDPDSGHVAPPEAGPRLMEDESVERKVATEYFQYQIEATKLKRHSHATLDLSALEEFTWQQQVEDYMREKGLLKTTRHNKPTDLVDLSELDRPVSKQWKVAFARAEEELRAQQHMKNQQEQKERSTQIAKTVSALRKRRAMTIG
ncbi:hypothetical protein [Paraburkholderia sp. RL17-373-BIF-A]|uniref:hypothetical protein n=1 Tax=Paraburkholderia sp. RL17-373-BIF-A TaxID=3031629 RepID=UPI0038B91ED1